ncbi:SDR family NAD(P)-dependent oxidoreductase [Streptomyces sp. AJS327]|uniref:SDR family NAD(P)-dependent oxidoreductase n=1 Tax=Streptomyces sp. AJS327 TaxID=2545265 RepID=UPI0015DF24F2|nr:SDR family NAD(P)-dependent oxidoreductase [Streptomyces sp. AJS327]MBA0052410.1 SDR family NAD(P)-dependent oxidoreductase [Streptomyces sp. AJS327]
MNEARRALLERVRRGEVPIERALEELRGPAAPTGNTPPGGQWFRPGWERTEPPPLPSADRADVLLALGDPSTADSVGTLPGGTLVTHQPGARPHEETPGVRTADLRDGESWRALLGELAARGGAIRRAVLVTGATGGSPADWLETAFHALTALASADGPVEVALVSLAGEPPGFGAALGGFAQVLTHEERRLRAVAVRVEGTPPGFLSVAELALAELAADRPGSGEVRYTGEGRWTRQLAPLPSAPPGDQPGLPHGAVCLVSGGAGGLGRAMATHLAGRHAARLVLLSRSPATDQVRRTLEEAERLGGRAIHLRADVTDPAGAERAVAEARDTFGPVDAVLHLAGVNADAYLRHKSTAAVREVLAPKIAGAMHLDEATRAEPLTLFALFSSTASFLGAPGQSDYAAAGRALGGFAHARHRAVGRGERRGATVAVHWPLWAGGGMDMDDEGKERLRAVTGMLPLPLDAGTDALEHAVRAGEPELLYGYGDTGRITAFAARHLATTAATPDEPAAPGADGHAEPPPGDRRLAAAEEWLTEVVTRTAKLPEGTVGPHDAFAALGVDSLLIRQLTAALQERLGPLPPTLLFDHGNVRELAGHLLRTHPGALPEPETHTPDTPDTQGLPPAAPPTAEQPPRPATATPRPGPAAAPADDGDIAVIGMAGRYPGADDLATFWDNLAEGRDCVGEVPPGRWDTAATFDPRPARPGHTYGRWGGFLREVDRFDPLFFGIAPRDAELMDPQERLFLETAWTALEDAGYSRRLLHHATRTGGEHPVGVFVGVTSGQYQLIGAEEWGRGNRVSPNSSFWSIANRLSYVLDAHGPSLAVDTACSSSLVAIHLACESIRRGESRMAFAGGVNLNLHPAKYVALAQLRFLSSDGRCRAFGDGGDGYVPGEGVGAVLLKPLADAVADGDPVRAVIKATAVNHGGTTNGYTVPGPRAQGSVVAEALRRADVPPESIGYVEAHGTGTALGDPIEIEGLERAFGAAPDGEPRAIGSVKSGIGHLESAAGIAGLTKCVLQLEHRALVPTLHCDPPNRNIDFTATRFVPQRTLADWEPPAAGAPRRAAVSSFGAGGANAHIVLEEYAPASTTSPASPDTGPAEIVPLSARTDGELRAVAERLERHLARLDATGAPTPTLAEIARTLLAGRDAQPRRAALDVPTLAALREALRAMARGADHVPWALEPDTTHPDPGDREPTGDPRHQARRWLAGTDVPWADPATTSATPRRVSLPGYPFHGRRYWIPVTAPDGTAPSRTLVLGARHPLLTGHQVSGRPVLPGVAHLLAVHATLERPGGATPRPLTDITWRAPLSPLPGQDLTLRVDLGEQTAGEREFTVSTEDAEGRRISSRGRVSDTPPTPPTPLDLAALRARCADTLTGREIYQHLVPDGITYGPTYHRLERAWRGDREVLAELRVPTGDQTAPGSWGDADDWHRHATTLDGALHALLPLGQDVLATGETLVPAKAARVELHNPPAGRCLVHATLLRADPDRGHAVCRVVLTDEEGHPHAVFHELTAVRAAPPTPATPTPRTASSPERHATGQDDDGTAEPLAVSALTPRWRVRPLPPTEARPHGAALILTTGHDTGLGRRVADAHPTARLVRLDRERPGTTELARLLTSTPNLSHVYFLGGVEERRYPGDDVTHLDAAQETGVLALHRLARALADTERRDLRLVVVTNDTQQTDDLHTAPNPFAAALIGYAKVAAAELPGVEVVTVDLRTEDLRPAPGPGDPLVERLTSISTDRPGEELALMGGTLLTRVLVPATLGDPDGEPSPFRDGGVYLLLGGAGGLGLSVAGMLARRHRARLVLVGRRPEEETPREELRAIEEAGGHVRYARADITDPTALREVVAATLRREGPLDGVIHTAFTMADSAIARLEEDSLRTVLAAKARGSVALHQALADQPLGQLVFFSSAVSFTGAPGQANYAAASTFQDAYARFLATRLGRDVTLINWGFWGETGAVATDAYRQRMRRLGVGQLTTADGLSTLQRAVASGPPQLVPMPLTARAAQHLGVVSDRTLRWAPASTPSLWSPVRDEVRAWLDQREPVPGADTLTELERLAQALVHEALTRWGRTAPAAPADEEHRSDGPDGHPHPAPGQRRLLDALTDMLHRAGHHRPGPDGVATPLGAPPTDSATLAAELRHRHPDSAPFIQLMTRCAQVLPDVLNGQLPGNEALFPRGDGSLVADVYRANRRAEHFNTVTARAVAAYARQRRDSGGPVTRILEVGAGTGATTAAVLDALRAEGLDAATVSYDYTDLSTSLVRTGVQRFAGEHPFLRGRALDIDGDLAAQDCPPGTYDIVVASNVLHATPDAAHTLGQVSALLRPGGLLALNEVTRARDFVTLCFGLTDGWWLYQDPWLRHPHSPLLPVDTWRALALQAGLRGFTPLGTPGGQETDQWVMLAERDAWTEETAAEPPRHAPATTGEPTATGELAATGTPAPPTTGQSPPTGGLLERTAARVAAHYAAVLHVDAEELDPAVPLGTYGSDSLADLDVAARLEKDLGQAVSRQTVEGGSAADIAARLVATARPALEALLGTPDGDTPDGPPEPTEPAHHPASPSAPVHPAPRAHPAPPPRQTAEPIAVIGLAGRYPDADTPDELWDVLARGAHAIREVPASRWSLAEHHDPRGADPTRSSHRWGAFLTGIDRFDPLLFGISPREAGRIDPQERLFLETVWCLLEDAGHTRRRATERARALAGTGVGVFTGAMYAPYELLAAERWGRGERALASSGHWSIANRTSHVFGFDGPSLAVDSACSSALTAVHLACESLRRGECGMAVAGGVNLILHPGHHLGLSQAGMLSPTGRSRAFAADADGFVTGEGVGAVLLRPLSEALRDGDRVHGVIVGSGVNSSGTRPHYTAPDGTAQTELIARTLQGGGIDPATIQYVEAQAVGSPLGDPVELAALTAAYQRAASQPARWAIGSLKPNIGHLESASGMAQLTKVLLQLRERTLAPTLCDLPHPDLARPGSPIHLVRERCPWPEPTGDGPRRAAISSFGAGGANAHLIVEQAPEPPAPRETGTPDRHTTGRERIFVLSARRPAELRRSAERLRDHLASLGGTRPSPADVAHTLRVGREPLRHRLAVTAPDLPTLTARLTKWLAVPGGHHPGVHDHTTPAPGPDAPAEATAAARWAAGAPPNWHDPDEPDARPVSLPHYPFARERYWLEGTTVLETTADTARQDPAPPQTAGGTEHHHALTDTVAAVLGVDPEEIDLDDALSDYGFDSVSVTELSARLRERHGLTLRPTLLYEARDLRGLAAALTPATPDPGTAADAPSPPRPETTPEPAPAHPATPPPPTPDPASHPASSPLPPVPPGARQIAVIGMAGAFPGAPDLDAFWTQALTGRRATTDTPPARAAGWDTPVHGAFLDAIDEFDAAFFRISPREARLMDPQHRLFLRTVWQAVEDAGYDPATLAGGDTGVFAGVASTEYGQLLRAHGVEADGQAATGNAHSVLANRVSYLLDLRGPSEPVDTACSSSLVAVHRAVSSLRNGECALALAGGVNLTLTPAGFLAFGASGMLSPEGRCATFTDSADGYVRGEGVGAVLLKPLDQARRDGDHVYAVIRGSAVNHGGRATSLTAPSATAQAEVIVRAWRQAGAGADAIGLVEAHGTGTELGDPVEVNGLRAAFTELGGATNQRCGLTTGKTNVGHLETAAGIAGFIRAVLALHHGVLPPLAGFDRPNPLIELAGSPFYLVDRPRPWREPADAPRHAGVSSFGFGGVNAHVALASAPPETATRPARTGPEALVLSAETPADLRTAARRLASHLERLLVRGSGVPLADIAHTLRAGRPRERTGMVVLATGLADAVDAFRRYLADGRDPRVLDGDSDLARELADATTPDAPRHARARAVRWLLGQEADGDTETGRTPRRVPLPGRVFRTDRYWLPDPPSRTPAPPESAPVPAARAPQPATPTPAPSPRTDPTSPEPAAPVAQPPAESSPPPVAPAPPQLVPAPRHDPPHAVITAIIAENLGLPADRVDPDGILTDIGVDSIAGLRVMQRVQQRYGDHIPMLTIVEHPTVNRLVAHLTSTYLNETAPAARSAADPAGDQPPPAPAAPETGGPPTPEAALAIPLRTGAATGVPTYCVHDDTGELTWAVSELNRPGSPVTPGNDDPVFGLEAATFGPGGPPATTVEAQAAACARAITDGTPATPVRLAGHGLGGLLAVETARLLVDAGWQVTELVLLDAGCPDASAPRRPAALGEEAALASVAADFAAAWNVPGRPEPAPDTEPAPDQLLDDTVDFLSRSGQAPLPPAALRDWCAAAATHRTAFRAAARNHRWRPLVGVAQAHVHGGQGDWSRWIVPPPRMTGVTPAGDATDDSPHLHDTDERPPFTGVVSINRDGTRPPSFWGHTLLGDVSYGLSLSHHLGLAYPVFGLEQFSVDGGIRIFDTIEEMAASHLRALRKKQPDGPYLLGGYSLGGVVAYEIARQLLDQGADVGHLTLIDAIMPGTDAWHGIDTEALEGEDFDLMSLVLVANALGRRWEVTRPLTLEEISGLDVEGQLEAVTGHLSRHATVDIARPDVARLVRANRDLIIHNNDALARFQPKPLAQPVDTLLFHSTLGHVAPGNPNDLPEVRRTCDDRSNGFAAFTGDRLTLVDITADHFSICDDHHIKTVAATVETAWHDTRVTP